MRILVVNKFFWNKSGCERVMFNLIDGYEERGHEVVHFAMSSSRNRSSPWSDYFVPEVRWEGHMGERLRAAGRVIYSSGAARRLRSLVREARPDVAHLHGFHHQLSQSIIDVLRKEGVGVIHTVHDYKLVCPNYLLFTQGRICERCRGGRFHHAVLHRCLKGAVAPSLVAWVEMTLHQARRTLERGVRLYVCPSRFMRDKLVEFGLPPPRLRVVPNGVDPDRIPTAPSLGQEFIYAGRLAEVKGLSTLLQAIARLDGARLAIAGTGPMEAQLRQEAARAAPGRVQFLGHLDLEELLLRFRESRALVIPSIWYENAPMVALEAMASGVPVVASRLGGIPEIVRDGVNGLLFEPEDAGELADCLAQLQRSTDVASSLGRNGRQIVEQEYSLSIQVERMLWVLEQVAYAGSAGDGEERGAGFRTPDTANE